METPVYAAFTGFPLAWTPGTNGPITVEPVRAPIHSKADLRIVVAVKPGEEALQQGEYLTREQRSNP
jgi:hypothetical protein